MMATIKREHIFSHLGQAPYRFDGFEVMKYQACPDAPIQPGTACDHCFTGIMNVFWLVSADNKRFKVGCDCISKSGDAGLKRIVSNQERIKRNEKLEEKLAKDMAKIKAAQLVYLENKSRFEALPHPKNYQDLKTGARLTLAHHIDWMMNNAGITGKLEVSRLIQKTLGQ